VLGLDFLGLALSRPQLGLDELCGRAAALFPGVMVRALYPRLAALPVCSAGSAPNSSLRTLTIDRLLGHNSIFCRA
jgi:hypothetical protein